MIFIDTGAFVARYMVRDQYHSAATACWAEIAQTKTPCLTSSHVVSESLTLLARRTTYRFAVDRARRIFASQEVLILRATADDEAMAVTYFERHAGQKMSFTDCISFALMIRHGIETAFSFDADFAIAGFHVLPALPE